MSDETMIALQDLYYAFAIPLNKEMKQDAMEEAKRIIDKETVHERRDEAGEGDSDIDSKERE